MGVIKEDRLQEIIQRTVDRLHHFFDVIDREELIQEAWYFVLTRSLKQNLQSSLYNRLKYLIRKEIQRLKLTTTFDEGIMYEKEKGRKKYVEDFESWEFFD